MNRIAVSSVMLPVNLDHCSARLTIVIWRMMFPLMNQTQMIPFEEFIDWPGAVPRRGAYRRLPTATLVQL